jgi:curved DNA-binding protein CbpA
MAAMATPYLYDILGVSRDASAAAIKAAFRPLAKDLHPDHGGDPERFRLLKLAYDVLSDPEQRRHYDKTGETPDDRAARAAEDARFHAMTGDFLVSLIAHGAAPQFTDIIELARNSAQQMLDTVDGQIAATRTLADRLAEARSRLHCRTDTNLLADILSERLSKLHHTIEDLTAQRARWVRLRETLKDYAYEVYVESVP